MAEDKSGYSAPALEKGLDILEMLARHGQPMSTVIIAAASGGADMNFSLKLG